jgi:regulator of sigma E protease
MHLTTLAQISGSMSVVLLVLGLGFIIFVHELGHFLVAKMVGIKVDQFAVGFGRAILCWRKGIGLRLGTTEPEMRRRIAAGAEESDFGETEYRLNWMPLGGYVKMLGQDDLDPTKLSEDPRSFNQKPIWARTAVVSAGVIVNVIFGALFFVIAFMWGVDFPPAEVGGVVQGSPALTTAAEDHPEVVGLIPGDRIVRLNGTDVPADFAEVKINSALSNPEYPLEVTVERPAFGGDPGGLYTFKMKLAKDPDLNLPYLGIVPPSTLTLRQAKNEKDRKDALKALGKISPDLRPGMRLTAVNDTPVTAHWQYSRLLQQSNGQALTVHFTNEEGSALTAEVYPTSERQSGKLPAPWKQGDDKTQNVPHLLGLVPPITVSPADDDHSPAKGKIEDGDVVVSVNGQMWPTIEDLVRLVHTSDDKVELVLLRDGERVETSITPKRSWWPGSKPKIGVSINWATDTTYVASVLPDSPAADLNILAGTRITAVNGTEIDGYDALRRVVAGRENDELALTFALPVGDGVDETVALTLDANAASALASLRWLDRIGNFEPLKVEQQTSSVPTAIAMGTQKTWLFMKQVYITILRLAQGTVKAEHLSGPVGIAYGGSKFASEGFAYLLYFLGLLSVNLAVINFLPLPIVDGGLFVLLMIEKLRGKPVPPQVQSAISVVGLVLLGAVFLIVTFHDISRLVGG